MSRLGTFEIKKKSGRLQSLKQNNEILKKDTSLTTLTFFRFNISSVQRLMLFIFKRTTETFVDDKRLT